MSVNKTYYHVLNVSPRASDEAVRKAWRAQALRCHPDRNPHNRTQAQRMFVLVNRAYMVLKTRPQREAYNRFLLSSRRDTPSPRNNGGFWGAMKEILWPFAVNDGARHG